MARIELEPGERFEHTHTEASTTYLVSGQVEIEIAGVALPLTSVPMAIPANTPHVMVNVGSGIAMVGCGHPYRDES
jgi:quercetin dioxygenase-like cupin family protein